VRSLSDAFAERLQLAIAPDPDVVLESVFKLFPTPQPVEVRPQPIQVGTLEHNKSISILVQLQMPPSSKTGFRTVARLDVSGDVMVIERQGYQVLSDVSVEISDNAQAEEPPLAILDALGKLTLYRMQQKAEDAVARGNVGEATRRLENLATRLLAAGQEDLAQMAIVEARRVASTNMLSEEGRKTLKFGTRMLLALPEPKEDGA
jgi:Ca-activated chloride channel family protein